MGIAISLIITLYENEGVNETLGGCVLFTHPPSSNRTCGVIFSSGRNAGILARSHSRTDHPSRQNTHFVIDLDIDLGTAGRNAFAVYSMEWCTIEDKL
jgi:hypothetical protein